MQLALVELREFSEDVSQLIFGQTHSAVRDLHAEDAHSIRSKLYHQSQMGKLESIRRRLSTPYLVVSGISRVEQYTGDAYSNFSIARSEFHLLKEDSIIIVQKV